MQVKLEENEEKGKKERKRLDISDKKASEKQFTTFCQFNFGSFLPHSYTLIHYCTFRAFLEVPIIQLDLEKDRKGKARN